jgi:hypothetical protein
LSEIRQRYDISNALMQSSARFLFDLSVKVATANATG